jgi:small nuclear ribonucleoprotein (snRNP)-like protein
MLVFCPRAKGHPISAPLSTSIMAHARPQGFDEFMNVVLVECEEVWLAKPATEKRAATDLTRKPLGKQTIPVL